MKGRRKINLVAVTVIAAACLLLSSALSWADVKLIVVRNIATNGLTASVCDSGKPSPCVPVTVPSGTNFTSHVLPTLGWDQTIPNNGGWTIVGMSFFGTNPNLTAWAGEVVYNSGSTPSATFALASASNPEAAVTANGASYEQVAYAAPAACTSYSYTCTQTCLQNGTCAATVTGSFPLSCSGGITPATTTSCTYVPPPCTSYTYTPGTCQPGNTAPVIQSVGIPSGCSGGATPATTVTCLYVAPQCTGYTYTTGACQSNNTAPVISSIGSPSGCSGGAVPATTQPCIFGLPTCTAANVITWGACQSNSTQTASTYASTCTAPATPLTKSCISNPDGTASYTELIFNAGSQSRYDSIQPGESKYYMFTVPAGYTTFSMSISTMSQNADLNITIVQTTTVPPTSTLDHASQDALTYYNSDIGLWGIPWFKAYPDPAWAKIGNNFDGEAIYLKASTATPVRNQAGFAASIPGTYYAVVNNSSSTAFANYAVYVKQ